MIDADRWTLPPVFARLQQGGRIAPEEMARTFNCGVGMAIVVSADVADAVASALEDAGEEVLEIGRIENGPRGCTVSGKGGSWNSTGDWSATHNA